jgi:hypothetical protein
MRRTVPGSLRLSSRVARRPRLTAVSLAAATLAAASCVLAPIGGHQASGAVRPSVSSTVVQALSMPAGGAQNVELNSVSCPNPRFCVAVGEYRPAGRWMSDQGEHAVVMRFDGTRWSAVAAPEAPDTELNGVDCVASSTCVAVGESVGAEGDSSPYIEAMHGKAWSVVSSPGPTIFSVDAYHLASVSCVSAGNCTAVGWDMGLGYGRGLTPVTGLVAHEGTNGWTVEPIAPLVPTQTWSLAGDVTIPSNAFDPTYLMSVSCRRELCLAAGEGRGFVEQGGTWTPLAASPLVFNGVSCWSGRRCLGVGRGGQGFSGPIVVATSTSIARLSGTQWRRVASPNTTSSLNVLGAVACWTGRSCVAVGSVTGPAQAQPTGNREGAALVEVESKDAWSLATLPRTPFKVDDALTAVSCPGPHTCIAVGQSVVNVLTVPSGPLHAFSVRVTH